ncbi:peptidase, partial [Candidatus Magnetomorum sp. HK-1]
MQIIDSQIAKTILNNTNSEFATVSIIENNLVLSHQAGVEGETQITVQGMSNGVAIEDSFNVYAYDSDIAPQIATAIEDITVLEDSSNTTIDLSSVFTDPDTDDHSIAKMIVSNTNEPLVNADITGNTLTLKYQADASGAAMITVRGTLRGKFVDESFTITVVPVDDPPVVKHVMTDITVNEDASDMVIDLTPIFTDPDNEDHQIVKSIVSNSNESLVSPMITGHLLVLSYVPNASGYATLNLKATSGGKSVETSVNILVAPVDDPPMIATPIQPIIADEDAPEQTIDITNVFTDPDDDDSTIQLMLTNNSNNNLLEANISGYSLTIRYLPEQSGSAVITIRAISNGLFVEDQLNITVNAVDDPPVLARAIDDVSMGIKDESLIIDLTDVFMDIDTSMIVKTIQSNTNPDLATVSIIENRLIIEHPVTVEGETEITIQAISNGQMVNDSFKIFVDASDVGPEINIPIDDIFVLEDSGNTVIDLTNVFTDPDNDNYSIIKSIAYNINESLISTTITDNQLILSPHPDASGTGII